MLVFFLPAGHLIQAEVSDNERVRGQPCGVWGSRDQADVLPRNLNVCAGQISLGRDYLRDCEWIVS